ncbi:MAG: sulfatase-like hydrolase/transferase [Planctomycetota bacterium]
MSRSVLALFVITFLVPSLSAAAPPSHVMLILLDDSGWTDFGCYGSQIDTPNVDRFASESMRFTDCHSAAPNCSPSRCGLLTGRTPSRAGIFSYLPGGHVMHLRDEEVTIAELLKDAGYRTGHFGKWHLSRLRSTQPQPADQGFEESLGTDNNASPSHLNPDNFVRNGSPVGPTKGYSCQLVVDATLDWLKTQTNENEKTFSCVWFHEPHTPIASPPELVAKYQKQFPKLKKKHAEYYANIENVDRAVGRLLAGMNSLGMTEDTLVFLTSDNGPLNAFSKGELRGRKSHVWEGGHRVPGVFRWPGKIEPDSVCEVPICGVDFLPTVCDAVGIAPPNDRVLDGHSLLPLLIGDAKSITRKRPLYWFFYRLNPAIAMREDDWLLIAQSDDWKRPKAHPLLREDIPFIKNSRPIEFELYHLKDDLSQRVDRAKSEPTRLTAMVERLRGMHREVLDEAPSWDIPETYQKDAKKKIWSSE